MREGFCDSTFTQTGKRQNVANWIFKGGTTKLKAFPRL